MKSSINNEHNLIFLFENIILNCFITYLISLLFQIFQECLVKECYNINNYSTERGLHLLRALEVGRKSIPSSVPPPTQYCLQLYSNLLHTTSSRVNYRVTDFNYLRILNFCVPKTFYKNVVSDPSYTRLWIVDLPLKKKIYNTCRLWISKD